MPVRNFAPEDGKKAIALWNRTLWADPIPDELFQERLLLDPNFDPDGFWVIEEGGELKAGAIGICRVTDLPWGYENRAEEQKDLGFLFPLLIEDSPEGVEHGRALLNVVEDYFRARQRKTVSVCEYGPLFFPDGVAESVYPRLYHLLIDSGYEVRSSHYSMRVDLCGFRIGDELRAIIAALEKEGIRFQPYSQDDLLAVRQFLSREFRGWLSHFANKIYAKAPCDEMVIVKQHDQVVGYCQYNYYGQTERVGPFGVAQSMRGRKIGQAMVAKLLEAMTRKTYQTAYFNSCSEHNTRFYAKNGFKVFRKKSILRKVLQP